ncbi:Cytochrome c biogenesis ATP-binding export protein CcmA [Sphingomonas sp. EC-HK361]|uniref:heme ABC exporter ATP-binding protein CcmA n=1 Tax=Sphingomonas sp. EC-HK361 TaxID=2038397 RepID=UPI0012563F10|nr:heme ABC exporter ATP-binding protein CcmA [Sphingomonas sp. EC-HK361]VVT04646.1 Cytochrome c biogenesis ATP-binding export protein CcmA [Sphingomonas sp. EC-HK361]
MSGGFALEDVTGVRAGRLLFARLSLRLVPGDAARVTGPNGVGKSSLLRIAGGLLRPAAGRVVSAPSTALLTEAAALDPERSVAQALGFWAMLDRIADPHAAVAAALRDLALDHLADVPVRILSTGQRRRIAMARVLAAGAELWLLDEPANGLDADAVERLEALIARHRAGGGMAIVATHQPIALPGAVEIALVSSLADAAA